MSVPIIDRRKARYPGWTERLMDAPLHTDAPPPATPRRPSRNVSPPPALKENLK